MRHLPVGFEIGSYHKGTEDTVALVQHDVPRDSCDWTGMRNVFHNIGTQKAFLLQK